MGNSELLPRCATKSILSEKVAVSHVPTIFPFLLGYEPGRSSSHNWLDRGLSTGGVEGEHNQQGTPDFPDWEDVPPHHVYWPQSSDPVTSFLNPLYHFQSGLTLPFV